MHVTRHFMQKRFQSHQIFLTKSVFQIYKDVRAEIGNDLTPEEKIVFLCEIPRLHAINGQL